MRAKLYGLKYDLAFVAYLEVRQTPVIQTEIETTELLGGLFFFRIQTKYPRTQASCVYPESV